MQNFTLLSDAHLELGDLVLPGGDLLIISGDLCEAKSINPHCNGQPTRHEKYTNKFIVNELPKYNKVIYVMGNHEHYYSRFNQTLGTIRGKLHEFGATNVTMLENETVEYNGTLFIGATLWTDCNKNDPLTKMHLADAMNDYHTITNRDGYKLTPDDTLAAHRKSVSFISETCQANSDKSIVVVTHHAPHTISGGTEYGYHSTGGYVSDLSELMLDHPQIKIWTHGHTHDPFDYMIGTTRVICNPRGYYGYERRASEYDPTLEFVIP